MIGVCSSDSSSDTTVAASDSVASTELELEGMWARTSPMATTMGAAYLSITSPVDDALLGVKADSSIAEMAQIHEMVPVDGADMSSDSTMAGGMGTDTTMAATEMKMQEVEKIALPAGTKVELKPGGYHIMLMQLVKPLETGATISLTLVFENAGEKTVDFPVMDDAPSGM